MEVLSYWALFAASFLSATVLPFSSEAVLAAALMNGGDPVRCLVLATLGNTLGGMTGYLLGRWGRQALYAPRAGLSRGRQQRWVARIERHGAVAAICCWLPVFGDFIAVALGAMKTKCTPTLLWMALGKGARYAVIIGALAR